MYSDEKETPMICHECAYWCHCGCLLNDNYIVASEAWVASCWLGYLFTETELGTPCLVQSPIPRPPITPLYSLLSGAPWFVTPKTWSKEEGEHFNTRADLKSAAMFNLKREEGRMRDVTGHRTRWVKP